VVSSSYPMEAGASASSSSVRAICANMERRLDWIIAVRLNWRLSYLPHLIIANIDVVGRMQTVNFN